MRMRSLAYSSAAMFTASSPSRAALSAATLTRLARSAPENPGVPRAITCRPARAVSAPGEGGCGPEAVPASHYGGARQPRTVHANGTRRQQGGNDTSTGISVLEWYGEEKPFEAHDSRAHNNHARASASPLHPKVRLD